ncbi:Variant surface glycoprotein MITAT 1.4A [Frankliniella fusca]|uniref:Variant surface glycoprotein MITAT 1.4A n=1 Tax=Frankliniella fusca TaxID=407009 RepID=A0AAE1LIE7_9NEOP|nr:Variant surface glycoprotein MITAT 1.4A [Frankliniella fusca]
MGYTSHSHSVPLRSIRVPPSERSHQKHPLRAVIRGAGSAAAVAPARLPLPASRGRGGCNRCGSGPGSGTAVPARITPQDHRQQNALIAEPEGEPSRHIRRTRGLVVAVVRRRKARYGTDTDTDTGHGPARQGAAGRGTAQAPRAAGIRPRCPD